MSVRTDVTQSEKQGAATPAMACDATLLAGLLDLMDGAVFIIDGRGIIAALNIGGIAMLGCDGEGAIGTRLGQMLTLVDRQHGRELLPLGAPVRGGVLTHLDGEAGEFRADWRVAGDYTMLSLVDETSMRMMQRTLQQRETLDILTGVPNREQFEARIDVALATCRAGGDPHHALIYLEIDHFALIADTAGSEAGDAVLRDVAAVITGLIRPIDAVGRLGGKAFGILIDGTDELRACHVARRILAALAASDFAWKGRKFEVSASAGVVQIDAADPVVPELLRRARLACLRAKEEGRGQVHIGHDTVDACAHVRQLAIAGSLKDAIAAGRISLVAQEIMALDGRGLERSFELLLRVTDRSGRIVPVGELVRAAERFDLMRELDRWVIEEALVRFGDRIAASPGIQLSINLSGSSLGDPAFLTFLREVVDASPVAAEALTFEVTETAVLRHADAAERTLAGLRELGCRIALDDFGVGLSNFDYLQRFPVDVVKVDGSFVRGMLERSRDAAIVEAIVSLARRLGIRTVLEHVESAELLVRARQLGADFAQGYFVGYPQPLDSILDEPTRAHAAMMAKRHSAALARNAFRP